MKIYESSAPRTRNPAVISVEARGSPERRPRAGSTVQCYIIPIYLDTRKWHVGNHDTLDKRDAPPSLPEFKIYHLTALALKNS